MKQRFYFEEYYDLENYTKLKRSDVKASFKNYLINTFYEFDDWGNRDCYNDFIFRQQSKDNNNFTHPLLFTPADSKLKILAEKAEDTRNWEEVVEYLFKHEIKLCKNWEPNRSI